MKNNFRILILSASHLCRNPRVFKEATSLANAGYEVTVQTVRSHRPSLEMDRMLTASAKFEYRQIELISGMRARLHRLLTRLTREAIPLLSWERPSTLGPTAALFNAARKLPADLIIAHTEAPLWVASKLLSQYRRVAADIEDWHSEDLPHEDRRNRPIRLLRSIESTVLQNASFTTTTSEALANALSHEYAAPKPSVLPNAFPLQPLNTCASYREDSTKIPRLCWFSQTTGPGRGLEAFLEAWKLTENQSELVLLGEVSDHYRQTLLEKVPERLRTSIQFHAMIPPDDLPVWLGRHDIGLALEVSTIRNRDLTITNKILQYLNAGLGVIASPTAGHREVFARNPDIGFIDNFSNPVETAHKLDQLLASKETVRGMQIAARTAAENFYCWEKQEPVLLDLVERALKK